MSQKKSIYIKKTPIINEKTGKRLYIKKKNIETKYIQITDDEKIDLLRYRIVIINNYKYKVQREKKIDPLYLKNKIKRVYSKIDDIETLTHIFNEINKIISQKKSIGELIDKNNIENNIENINNIDKTINDKIENKNIEIKYNEEI